MGQWKLQINFYFQIVFGIRTIPIEKNILLYFGPFTIFYSFDKEATGISIFKWYKDSGRKWEKEK